MKKIVIALMLGMVSIMSCTSCEEEKESPIVATDGAKATVTLGEGAK